MVFWILVVTLIISFCIYVFYTSYFFQMNIHKKKTKMLFIDKFVESVKGIYISKAYFAVSHRIVHVKSFKSFSNRQKVQFGMCYNVVTFKTPDANWELFFHLVKQSTLKYDEILTLRVFPINNRIKSEGNVEKTYSKLNIFTNNRYLTGILESNEVTDLLKWLIRCDEDILLISPNNLHFKAFLKNGKFSSTRA
ncbi:MAG: hypothetical protein KC550_01295, partial [Nanoarchaeota archaeon]|nr:hypothetical protein [Nanoarchaeota archaeon]